MKTEISKYVLKRGVALALAGLVLSFGSAAVADETVGVSRSVSANTDGLYNAFEIGIGAGYTQGVGDVGNGISRLQDQAGPGIAGELDLGWRIDPNWLVGVYGTAGWLSTTNQPTDAHNNWTSTAGIQGQYHFLPGESIDPWVGLGAGWRGYWVNRGAAGQDSRQGLDFARVQVGVDIPVARGVAISPFVSAAGSVLLSQQLAQQTSFSNINNPNVNVFFNAGVMGRFDVLGSSSSGKTNL